MPRLLTIAALALSAGSASAHPHVFVDAGGAFLFDAAGRLEGVRISWLYDAFTTLSLYETLDLDKDRDGALNAADLEKIKQGETNWPPEYEGDTYLWIDSEEQRLSRPENATVWMEDDRVGVAFDLYLDAPREVSGKAASLKLYDPLYFYAYSVAGPARLDGADETCRAKVVPFNPDAQLARVQKQLQALSREEIPDDPNIGALFAEEILLQCD